MAVVGAVAVHGGGSAGGADGGGSSEAKGQEGQAHAQLTGQATAMLEQVVGSQLELKHEMAELRSTLRELVAAQAQQ